MSGFEKWPGEAILQDENGDEFGYTEVLRIDDLNLPAGGEIEFNVDIAGGELGPLAEYRIVALAEMLLRADLNDDDEVGAGDLGILAGEWQQSGSDLVADINGDHTVSAGDLGILAGEWQETTRQTLYGSATVPEPVTLSLLVLGAFGALRRRRSV